jgi:hypothetical protein
MLDRVRSDPRGQVRRPLPPLIPLDDTDSENSFWVGTGPQPPQDQLSSALFTIVTPGYRDAMQFPLLKGRFFDSRDTLGAAPVILIDDVMAKHVFPGQDPIGKQISMLAIGPVTVVGVVGHVKHWGLDSDETAKVRDEMYFPFAQIPDKFMSQAVAGLNLMVRSGPEPLSLTSAVAAGVAGPTRDQPLSGVRSLEQIISQSLAERRFTMLLLLIFAATALLLAAVGIYGVMSYAVTRQTPRNRNPRGFGSDALGDRGAGSPARYETGDDRNGWGAVGGVWCSRTLWPKLLYGVRPADPVTLVAVALLLGGVALLACYLPARRATAVDPATALRCE